MYEKIPWIILVFSLDFDDIYLLNRKRFFNDIPDLKWNDWGWQCQNTIKNSGLLLKLAGITDKYDSSFETNFAVTPHLSCLIDYEKIGYNNSKLKISDPIARQVIPGIKEYNDHSDNETDPFSEYKTSPLAGCIRRYKDRLLVLPTNKCASYCRYCTRKWNWDRNFMMKKKDIANIKKYLNANPDIREIIISGGDPLLLSATFLDELIYEIRKVNTIEAVRIATRLLSFLPQKIDDDMASVIKKYKPIWVITHFNHHREITPLTSEAVERLLLSGACLANQTVMLKGVNDDYDALKKLFYSLESIGIKPYYIFHCDPIKGTSHFNVPVEKGKKVMNRLRKNISGLCLPLYVMDMPGKGKTPIC